MGFENLLGGAAAAAGPAPSADDPAAYRQWLTRVSSIAADLQRLAASVLEHESRKEECMSDGGDGTKKYFYGKLMNVRVITKGSGDKTVKKGYLQFDAPDDAQNVDEDGYEFIETAPLSTPEGRFEYDRAAALVGQRVVVYKRLIPLPNGRKARECAAIDPADSLDLSSDTPAAQRPAAAVSPPAPPVASSDPFDDAPAAPAAPQGPVSESTEDLDALIERAEAVFETAPAPAPAPAPTEVVAAGAGRPSRDVLAGFTPASEPELVELAETHLGKTAADVRAFLVEKYNLPEGRKLPSRQYTVAWREIAGVN